MKEQACKHDGRLLCIVENAEREGSGIVIDFKKAKFHCATCGKSMPTPDVTKQEVRDIIDIAVPSELVDKEESEEK